MSDDLFNSIYNKSLDLLSRREHSKKEIKEKLILRFDNKELIDSVLLKLLENNLVNDARFTENYVSSRKRKGFGPKKIIYELLSKGVKESISEAIIAESDDWEQVAKSTFAKKYKDGICSESKDQLKQKSFLQNRGFRFKEIESVFKEYMLWFKKYVVWGFSKKI